MFFLKFYINIIHDSLYIYRYIYIIINFHCSELHQCPVIARSPPRAHLQQLSGFVEQLGVEAETGQLVITGWRESSNICPKKLPFQIVTTIHFLTNWRMVDYCWVSHSSSSAWNQTTTCVCGSSWDVDPSGDSAVGRPRRGNHSKHWNHCCSDKWKVTCQGCKGDLHSR